MHLSRQPFYLRQRACSNTTVGVHGGAQAYDRSLVRLRGTAAATNFALSDYRSDLADYHKMQQVGQKPIAEAVPTAFRLIATGEC